MPGTSARTARTCSADSTRGSRTRSRALADPGDRAQLVPELHGMREHQCQATVGDPGEERRRLVVAEVECPHRRDETARPRERRRKGGDVLVLGRPGACREKGQLGAQEPDALGARFETRRHLGRGGSVAEQRHGAAVAGDRRKPTRCDSLWRSVR